MTELSWLKEREFFTSSSHLWKVLFAIGILIVAVIIILDLDHTLGLIDHSLQTEISKSKLLMALITAAF